MSSIEMRLAPMVNSRRQEISKIDTALRGLNEIFPDQRKKPDTEKDPEYQAVRSGILEKRRALSGMQHRDRDLLRQVNGR